MPRAGGGRQGVVEGMGPESLTRSPIISAHSVKTWEWGWGQSMRNGNSAPGAGHGVPLGPRASPHTPTLRNASCGHPAAPRSPGGEPLPRPRSPGRHTQPPNSAKLHDTPPNSPPNWQLSVGKMRRVPATLQCPPQLPGSSWRGLACSPRSGTARGAGQVRSGRAAWAPRRLLLRLERFQGRAQQRGLGSRPAILPLLLPAPCTPPPPSPSAASPAAGSSSAQSPLTFPVLRAHRVPGRRGHCRSRPPARCTLGPIPGPLARSTETSAMPRAGGRGAAPARWLGAGILGKAAPASSPASPAPFPIGRDTWKSRAWDEVCAAQSEPSASGVLSRALGPPPPAPQPQAASQ